MPTEVLHSFEEVHDLYNKIAEEWDNIEWQTYLEGELLFLEAVHESYFENDVGPDGSGWPPLKEATKRRKGHGRILEDTLRLRLSLTDRSSEALREAVTDGAQPGLTFGTWVDYSHFHNDTRPHIGIRDEHLAGMVQRATDYAVASVTR